MCDNQAIIIKLEYLNIFKIYKSNPDNQVHMNQNIVINNGTHGGDSGEMMKILLLKEREKGIRSSLRWLIFFELVIYIYF